MGIIKTLADTALNKMKIGNIVNRYFADATVTYALKVRSSVEWVLSDVENIRREVATMGGITFSKEELAYIETQCKYLPDDYLTFLKDFRLEPSHVKVWLENGELQATAKGLWCEEIYWELLISIIRECYYENRAPLDSIQLEQTYEKARNKAKKFAELSAFFIDTGTYRRRSYEVQDAVIRGLCDGGGEFFLGTTNAHFATKYNLTPHAMMAHEMFSAIAAMYGVENANKIALEKWVETYQGFLGPALTDTYTTDFFLRTFNPFLAELFDELLHDSGEPKVWFDKVINHYTSLGIEPKLKKAWFSDSIDSFEKMKGIINTVGGRMQEIFCIGTWLTNDFDDLKPLNMVFKLAEVKRTEYEPRQFAVKLSDVSGKYNGDENTIKDYLTRI